MTVRCPAFVILYAAAAYGQAAPDAKLLTSRNTYSPVMELLKPDMGTVTDAQLEQLKHLQLEPVWQAVQSLGYRNCHFSGMKSSRPTEKLVGRALTIRYLPQRPDLTGAMTRLAKEGDWPRAYNVRAAEEAKPGDVIVVDLGGGISDGIFFGDVSALGAQTAGANGVVLYGSSRDLLELQQMKNFPVLAMGWDPKPATQIGVDWNIPIRVGDVTVIPGDVVVGDAEAVLFFPAKIAGEVIRRATAMQDQEMYERALTKEKKYRFRDVYPLSPELRKQYEQERGKKPE